MEEEEQQENKRPLSDKSEDVSDLLKWYEERAKVVSSSNVSDVLGFTNVSIKNKDKDPNDKSFSVFVRKYEEYKLLKVIKHWPRLTKQTVKLLFSKIDNSCPDFLSQWGVNNEGNGIRLYLKSKHFDDKKDRFEEGKFFKSPHEDWIGATPDGLVYDKSTGELVKVVEVKSPLWQVPEEIPIKYWWQCQIQMYCTNTTLCDFQSFKIPRPKKPTSEVFVCRFERDDEAIKKAIPVLKKFRELSIKAYEDIGADELTEYSGEIVRKVNNTVGKKRKIDMLEKDKRHIWKTNGYEAEFLKFRSDYFKADEKWWTRKDTEWINYNNKYKCLELSGKIKK